MLEKSVPFYIQVTRILRQELAAGRYPVASRMPDENTLAARFGVSKDVIRASMRLLAKEGLVKAIRSRGTFVNDPPTGIGSNFVLLSYHGSLHLDAIRSGIEHSMPNDCNLVLNRNILDNLAHERNILENLDISRTRVLIAAPSYQDEADNTEAYGQLLRQGLPLLIIDHSLPNLPADEISFDEYNATAELTREALIRAKERPVAMFCLNQPTDRISKIRCQAMLDVWQEFGGNSANRRLYMIQCLSWEHAKQSMQMMRAYCSDQFQANVVLFPSTPVAWEFFKAMRELGKTNGIQQISGIGDILRGDDDFNRRLYAHYRLFDEFTPLIKEVLRARLSGEEAPSVPIRRTIGFKPMNSIQIHHYFTERFA